MSGPVLLVEAAGIDYLATILTEGENTQNYLLQKQSLKHSKLLSPPFIFQKKRNIKRQVFSGWKH